MVYLVFPVDSFSGWGVCGKYLVKELSNYTDVKLVAENVIYENILDELDYRLLIESQISKEEINYIKDSKLYNVNGVVLHAIAGNTLISVIPQLKGEKNFGYIFFEENILSKELIENGRRNFDLVIAGSKWNEALLRYYGLNNVETILQGIDPSVFNPYYSEKQYFKDKFVIFSGGKFEFRKGQDIVIKAFGYLQDKYKDVILINSWYNLWPHSFQTMKMSKNIHFSIDNICIDSVEDYIHTINKIISDNGIDISNVITLPLMPNIMMAKIYKNTDIGLFPNRCEGGSNLVMMEYMACGKPVIASYNSGHKDVLNEENSILLSRMKPVIVKDDRDLNIAIWEEPDIDEVIEKLIWAYHNREELLKIGKKAGKDMSRLTWSETAKRFYEIMIR
jgi:glycosyltransferase involved in cell wall biosynthesis